MNPAIKHQRLLFIACLTILLVFASGIVYFLFSSHQKIQQFQLAEKLFQQQTPDSMASARGIYKTLLDTDDNLEIIYARLAMIADFSKDYPGSVYYWSRAQSFNPLSKQYQEKYIESLQKARLFKRLETYLGGLQSLTPAQQMLRVYVGCRNGNHYLYSQENTTLKKTISDNPLVRLHQATCLKHHLSLREKQKILTRLSTSKDFFIRQESLLTLAHLLIRIGNLKSAEHYLKYASQENFFAAGPELAEFYATYKSFGEAIQIYEKYLKLYRAPLQAMELAEIYTILKNREALHSLLKQFYPNPSKLDLYTCFYFKSLLAFLDNDMENVAKNLEPIQNIIGFPLARYMYLCVALNGDSHQEALKKFEAFAQSRRYLDLPGRGADLTEQYIAGQLKKNNRSKELMQLTEQLHRYRSTAASTYLLLKQKQASGLLSRMQAEKSLEDYPDFPGLWKIAIQENLKSDPNRAAELVEKFKKNFPKLKKTILVQEIDCKINAGKLDDAAELFQKNLVPPLHQLYWDFAIKNNRKTDLELLKDAPGAEKYRPFCQAALLMLDGRKDEALNILETAPAGGSQKLLFYAASTLGRGERLQAALKRYSEFPSGSPYGLLILANCAEIQQALGNETEALRLARQAWKRSPDVPEFQLCYADKLYRQKMTDLIPDVIRLPSTESLFDARLKPLWLAGIKSRMQQASEQDQKQELRKYIQLLKLYAPNDEAISKYTSQLPPERKLP